MITIRGLHKRFHGTDALRGVDLDIPQGKVTAFLGPNGAGKTTTIKCAMNLIGRDAGDVSVLGVDARSLGPRQWQSIGYVSENRMMPGWMTVPELLNYLRPMYNGSWDRDFEKKLLAEFDLPLKTELRALSRGQRMKAALLSSLAYRPQLVVLDEPFSGLDPLVRDEFLTGLLELTETEGWTVWISSHDIEEVERFADRVAILNDGRVDIQEDVETLQSRFRSVELWFDDDAPLPGGLPATWLNPKAAGRTLRFTDASYDESSSETLLARIFPEHRRHEARRMTLREIFVALARSYRTQPD
ncbi:ABC transporter ATP-binding protein [Luteolibacter yonseiensis]|uniref:ABC transporter ATP-binding protein n=1 Tax=Luteolibacter yonseiensis TaxID=1144680 RepID=A0A934R596_9BACT|nr:ABC transporter ATP-binding protein [Luteolibacter yonseiensis]MBK1815715.1 ABC transporter ATP-binding protein [Luteolibacter yonseiensis]